MHIELDDLSRPEVHALLAEHLQTMHEVSPQESDHALSFETGTSAAFKPAHRLHESLGFVSCGPFGAYVEVPDSFFMSRELPGLRRRPD